MRNAQHNVISFDRFIGNSLFDFSLLPPLLNALQIMLSVFVVVFQVHARCDQSAGSNVTPILPLLTVPLLANATEYSSHL